MITDLLANHATREDTSQVAAIYELEQLIIGTFRVFVRYAKIFLFLFTVS
jgi:hypothetical protein